MKNKRKGRMIADTFEQIEDFGKSTVKHVTRQTLRTFSPLDILEDLSSTKQSTAQENKNSQEKKPNHTPINTNLLKTEYEQQDKKKEIALKNRLFQLVKQGDEKELQKKKQKEQEKKQVEVEEEQKKREEKKKEEEQKGQVPQGKIRRSIFSPRTKAKREHFETRPSTGKQ